MVLLRLRNPQSQARPKPSLPFCTSVSAIALNISNLGRKPCASIHSAHILSAFSTAGASTWEASCDFWWVCILKCDCRWYSSEYNKDSRRKHPLPSVPPKPHRYCTFCSLITALGFARGMVAVGNRNSVVMFLSGGLYWAQTAKDAIPVPTPLSHTLHISMIVRSLFVCNQLDYPAAALRQRAVCYFARFSQILSLSGVTRSNPRTTMPS